MRVVGSARAFEEHGHIFSLDFFFSHWNRNPRSAKEEVEETEGHLEGGRQKMSEKFELENQALLFIKRLGVYNHDPPRQNLYHALVSQMRIHI